jgi:hypothetical protein
MDSHTVGISSKMFSGANNVFVADSLSSGISASGNSTNLAAAYGGLTPPGS